MNKQNDTTKLYEKWGRFGMLIRDEGEGGGFTALPNVLDVYERALGLERDETWLIKRLLNHYWTPGDEVYPSFRGITKQAAIGEKRLHQLRRQLEAKGFVKLTGRRGGTDRRFTISIAPLFDALALCVLCDPTSRISRRQRHAGFRAAITEILGNDQAIYSWFFGKHLIGETKLPLSVEAAKDIAKNLGITLDWEAISQMQGQAEKAVKKDSERYHRLMLIRASVKSAADEAFRVNWNFEKAFDLLKWLDERVTSDEVYAITEEYMQTLWNSDGTHRFRDFDRFIRQRVESLKQGDAVAVNRVDAVECDPTYTDSLPDESILAGNADAYPRRAFFS